MVRLLDVDPDLGGLLNDSRREHAERELVVRTHRLPVGPWDVSRLAGATADHIGLLVIDGILSRELVVADHVSAELLGPGDLVRPWQPTSRTGLLPVDAVWTVLSPMTVAVLDRRFAAEMTRYPEITAALFDRLSRAVAAPRDHAGDLAADARRSSPEGTVLAPGRALGSRVRRWSHRATCAHSSHSGSARGCSPADGFDRAERARGA